MGVLGGVALSEALSRAVLGAFPGTFLKIFQVKQMKIPKIE